MTRTSVEGKRRVNANPVNTNTFSYKERSAAKRKKIAKKNRVSSFTKFFVTLMVVAAAVCIILFSNHSITNADESGHQANLTKYYKTITIEAGDTLWSIAKEYKSGDYKSTQDYVDELISMNNLHSDQITSGQKLVVAYFE